MVEIDHKFGELLLFHRRRLNLSQQEAAAIGHIHSTDVSKIERFQRKAPNAEVVLRWVEGFHLTHAESIEFVMAAGYSSRILRSTKFQPLQYPEVQGDVVGYLRGNGGYVPVWTTDTQGFITGANALAYRLWGALDERDDNIVKVADRLIGQSIWEVLMKYNNTTRIEMPTDNYNSFWYVTLAVWSKVKDTVPVEIVEAFEKVIKAHPTLCLILEYGTRNIDYEWKYTLRILPLLTAPAGELARTYLEFDVEVERIMDGEDIKGFLFICRPQSHYTIHRTQREYERLIDTYTKERFVQRIRETHDDEDAEQYPSHFPAIHHDITWFTNFENTTLLFLYGKDAGSTLFRGQPYFAWLFSPLTDELTKDTGGIDPKGLLAPIRAFLTTTDGYEYLGEYAKRYGVVKAYLLEQLQERGWQYLLADLVTKLTGIDTVNGIDKPPHCFTFSMKCPFTKALPFTFDVVARQPNSYEGDYRVTLTPANEATNIALMLLRLHRNEIVRDVLKRSEYEQYVCLLALLRTLHLGLKKGKGDGGWKVDKSFEAEYQRLVNTQRKSIEDYTLQAQFTMAQLLLSDADRQHGIRTMLKDFLATMYQIVERETQLQNGILAESIDMEEYAQLDSQRAEQLRNVQLAIS